MDLKGGNKMFAGSDIKTSHRSGSKRDDLQLTFGTELEVVLAFDIAHLLEDPFLRHVIEFMHYQMIRVEAEFPVEQRKWKMPRPALGLAQEILRREGLKATSSSDADMKQLDKNECYVDYSGWNLVEDGSINYTNIPDDVLEHAPDRFNEDRLEKLYGAGVELVSRVLQAPRANQNGLAHPSLQEVSRYVKALAGRETDDFACLPNESCGLHVHVGVGSVEDQDSPATFPLPVLQHLSLILLQYETVISSLFPFHRRGQDHEEHTHCVSSNLMLLRRTRHVCPYYFDEHTEDSLSDRAALIFDPDMTADELCARMSGSPDQETDWEADLISYRVSRYKFINFRNLHSGAPVGVVPPTLEFRHHESTVNPDEIKHWILFVLALIRAAERMAKQYPSSPPPITPSEKILSGTLPSLFTLLQLNPQQQSYWSSRVDRFKNTGTPEPSLSAEYWGAICPECHEENRAAIRDVKVRGKVEVRRVEQLRRMREADGKVKVSRKQEGSNGSSRNRRWADVAAGNGWEGETVVSVCG